MESPKVELERCYFEDGFKRPLPAMQLHWDGNGDASAERNWHMPDGVSLKGPAPRRFGITVRRVGDNSYQVCVLWNQLSLRWGDLTRTQIMASSLSIILQAIGTDLWYLLNQPVEAEAMNQAA